MLALSSAGSAPLDAQRTVSAPWTRRPRRSSRTRGNRRSPSRRMVVRRWPGRLTSTTCCSSSRGSTPLTSQSWQPTSSVTSATCMRPGACCPSGCAARHRARGRALPPPREPPATSVRSCQVTSAVHAYDASACRLRWAQLDHEACGLVREAVRRQAAGLAPFESPPPPAAPAAAPTVSAGDPVRPRVGAAEVDDEEEESEEEDASGVVDVNLLRRRLMADAGFTVSAAEAPQVRPLPVTLALTPALTREPEPEPEPEPEAGACVRCADDAAPPCRGARRRRRCVPG